MFSNDNDAAHARKQREQIAEERRAALMRDPVYRARAARLRGARVFQIDLPLSQTVASEALFLPVSTRVTGVSDAGGMIEAIEHEGWHLDNVGYVYRMLGTVSKERYIGSAEREAIAGEIIGIYLFRATEGPAPQHARSRTEMTGEPELPATPTAGRAVFDVAPGPAET